MKRAEREALLRQGVTLPETPVQRRQLAGLAADLEENPVAGKPLRQRLRNFRPSADDYLASLGGPRAYMTRLRQIETETAAHEAALGVAYAALAEEVSGDALADRWRERAAAWDFSEVNDLIDAHNRWYPVEARLRMDPATRDYALVNGRSYRLEPLGPAWILERFPPEPGLRQAV